jgi:hypothetical protein
MHMGTKSTKKTEVAAAPAAKAPPKRKIAVRPGITAARKPAAAKPAKSSRGLDGETPAAALAAVPEVSEIPTEVVALRAYFIAEARQANGHDGDPVTDWLEAERQIRFELK